MAKQKVNILGTEYEIEFVDEFPEYLSEFEQTADALFNAYDRTIFVKNDKSKDITDKGRLIQKKKNLRHEIIHAFLYESGLSSNTYGQSAHGQNMRKWLIGLLFSLRRFLQYIKNWTFCEGWGRYG